MPLMTTRIDRSPVAASFIAALVFVASALLFALGMDTRLGIYDEGIILAGAMRVASGEVPHRDFYANYGPANFYLLAALFRIFGQYALIERALDTFVRAGIVTLCYTLSATHARTGIALASALISGLWLFTLSAYGYPIFSVLLLLLLICTLLLPALSGVVTRWRLAGVGAMVGIAALFRYDVAFLIFAAIVCALVVSPEFRDTNRQERLSIWKDVLMPYVLGTAVVFLPVAALYLAVAPIEPFIHDIFFYPATYYSRMRSLPFSLAITSELVVYLPIVVCGVAAYSLASARASTQGGDRSSSPETNLRWRSSNRLLFFLSLIVGALYLKGVVRVSPLHMLASLIPSIILLAVVLERSCRQGRSTQALVCSVSVFALAVSLSGVLHEVSNRHRHAASVLDQILSPATSQACAKTPDVPSIACLSMASEQVEVVRFLIQNTRPDERIFVGLTRHDKIVVNDNMTYFAAMRLPATRWHQFDPGLQTRADVQSDIIGEFEAQAVRYIVLESQWDNLMEPNDSAKSSNVHLLDDYIRRHYRQVKSYKTFSILHRDS